MFFRRQRPKEITFEERMEQLRNAGFTVTTAPDGLVMVTRDGFAAVLENRAGAPRVAERAGILMCGKIGKLVDSGFQKFFITPDGLRKPALASELKDLHAFQEDLREALGLVSLYNESLGT